MRQLIYLMAIATAQLLFADTTSVVLFTGIPCAGKTTLATKLQEVLPHALVLDGDVIRKTINHDLGFSKEDREENLRRVIEMVKLLKGQSPYILLAFVSPYESIRQTMRQEIEKEGMKFFEVFVNADLKTCMERDVKGMYQKALEGKIAQFTGLNASYNEPEKPDLVCHTDQETIEESVQKILSLLNVPSTRSPHALFIGRWSPFHKGHFAIMEKVYQENPNRPLLIMVRDNKEEFWSAEFRKGMVEAAMKKKGIPATVMIIPDIDSVNWGRGVGYTPRLIEIDYAMQQFYSGTKIRQMIQENDFSWTDFVCEGTDEFILKHSQ